MIHRHYLVSGRVQGVGFRRFTEREALAHGLTGRTRNLRDGRVEALACGSIESLKMFEAALSRGPAGSSVSEIEAHDIDEDDLKSLFQFFESGFVMQKDGETSWL